MQHAGNFKSNLTLNRDRARCSHCAIDRRVHRLVIGATPVKWGVHIHAKYAITWTYAYSAYFVDINAYFLHMFCKSLHIYFAC